MPRKPSVRAIRTEGHRGPFVTPKRIDIGATSFLRDKDAFDMIEEFIKYIISIIF